MRSIRVGIAGLMALAVVGIGHESSNLPTPSDEVGRAYATHVGAAHSSGKPSVGLVDKRGKIVVNSKTYAIYWGKPTEFPADVQPGVTALLTGLNRSSYLATIDEYMRGKQATTRYVRSFVDVSRPPATDPTPQVILAEVRKVLRQAAVKPDANAVYLVFSSNLPKVDYCAWHAAGDVLGVQTQVAYVPNTSGTSTCYRAANFPNVSPYSFGTRSIADNAAHELLEAMTDPIPGTSWVDSNFEEIGDKCDFVYSSAVALNGQRNVWQLQSQWSNRAKACVQVGVVSQIALPAKPHRQSGSKHTS